MAAVVGVLAAMLKNSPAKNGLRHNMAAARIKFKFPYRPAVPHKRNSRVSSFILSDYLIYLRKNHFLSKELF